MGNKNEENYKDNVQQSTKINETDKDSDKIIYIGNDKNQIYNRENESDNKITNINNTDNLNPFTVAIEMWQNYINSWSETYKQLLFKNSPMVNGEFLFLYWKSSSNKTRENHFS
jgi:hypothetical protein